MKVEWLFKQVIDIPDEWDWQQLLDNSSLKGRIGWQGLTSSEYRDEGKFHLVTGTDFKDGRIDWETCVYVDEERYSQDTNIQLKKHDILITKDGTIGKIAYIDDLPLPATLNTGVFVVRPIDEKYVPLFLYYILQSNYFIKFITRIKAGSTISHLYQKDFKFFHFPIPPIIEQQKIASILSNIDKLIQKQQQVIEETQKLKKEQSYELLTKGIGHSNFKPVNYGLRWMNEKFPSEWIPTPLKELCEIRKNTDISSKIYIGLENIEGDGNNNLISKEDASLFTSTRIFKKGDILYGKLRPYLNKIWLATESGYCSTDIIPLVVNKKILNLFLLHLLTSKIFVNYAISTSSGTKMPRTEWDDIKKFKVVLPPTIEEQQKIASILSNLDLLIQQEKQYKEKLEKIKRGLMQQLLTGKTRVKV